MTRFLWTQMSNFGPSPRSGSVMAYDSNRGKVVLFGGRSATGAFYGDTWEWDGALWTQVEDIGPSPRFLSGLVYDTAKQIFFLFGGRDSAQTFLGDTWQWDGSRWTQLSDSGPAGRSSHAMAFDSNRNRTVLFGGQASPTTSLGDTWEFDGDNWTQLQDAGPQPRGGHVMAYDNPNNRVVLFGGVETTGNSFGDTWTWDGQEWVQIAEFGPSPRLEAAFASTQDGSLILYGGVNTVFNGPDRHILADSWELIGQRWTQRQDIGPPPLHEAAIAFDNLHTSTVLFGGITSSPGGTTPSTADTWLLPAPPLRVASLEIAPTVASGQSTGLSIFLNRLTPMNGVTVNFSGPIFQPNGSNLGPITLEGGISGLVGVAVAFAPGAGSVTFSAAIGDTPPVSATVNVQP